MTPSRVALCEKWPCSWLHGATLLNVVVALNLNISLDLLGGTNLFECKLDFRMNLLWELMRTGLKQMLECSFQTCEFGTAVQFVMQYYHTNPVSKANGRNQVAGVASEPQTFGETNTTCRM